MIPEIRTGILEVDMEHLEGDEEQLEAEEKLEKEVEGFFSFTNLHKTAITIAQGL